MSTDADIVAFIRARLDEDEQDALNALRGYTPVTDAGLADWQRSARWRSSYQHVTAVHDIPIPADVLERGDIWTKVATIAHGNYPAAYHIARHDPSRELRGVKATRSVLAVARWLEDSGRTLAASEVRRALASEHSTHPDYRPEWTL